MGDEARVEFFALEPADATAVARVRGAVAPGTSGQPMTVLLNDREIAGAELAPGWADVRLPLPAPALRHGRNRLVLRFARPLVPAASPGGDERPLAACFRTLEIGTPRPPERPRRLELGAEAKADLLVEGWGAAPADGPAGAGSRWALAPSATVRLEVGAPADRRLTLAARRPTGLSAQRLEVWLNGHQLLEQDVGAEWSEVRADAPREEWLPGSNLLRLRFGGSLTQAGERRGAQIAELVVDTLGEPAPRLERDAEGPFVRQKGGTAVDLFRRLPARAPRLVLAARGRGAVGAELPAEVALEIEPEGGALTELWREPVTGDLRQTVDLSAWAGELARLRLSVTRGGGLSWRRLELQGAAAGPLAEPARAEPQPSGAGPRPNLLLYVIDTLRADHTSLYGYHRATTPRLEALAAEAIVFDPAYANASWTRPGTVTLLTGTLPSINGAMNTLSRLAPEVELVSETLRRAGYATYGLVTNPNLRPQWGIDRGWDEYRYIDLGLEFSTSSAVLNTEVIPRLAQWAAANRPFFLYLHSMDPHAPYRAPEGHRQFLDADYRGPVDGSDASVQALLKAVRHDGVAAHVADLERLRGLYDGSIRHNDEQIGILIDALAAHDLLESTAILVTSDHGEEFFEHGGAMHGHSLYQEQIRIPMLLRPPGGVAARRVAGAQQIDVAVMLSALAGVGPPRTAIGRDLLRAGDLGDRPVFAEEELRDRRLWSYIEDGMKLHYNRNRRHARWQRQEPRELFDLAADAGEKANLYTARPVLAGYLLERARVLAASLPAGADRDMVSPEELSEDLREQLRALGYLQ